ncbi:MAG: hypothetical protein KDK24_13445 [Pseudooceanicola sp.]|nr:hypothetical protein [Pseudooceanicola sp.]
MNDNVENIILEQLKAIRSDLSEVKGKLEHVETSQKSLEGMMFGPAGYFRDIDMRVENIETRLGG